MFKKLLLIIVLCLFANTGFALSNTISLSTDNEIQLIDTNENEFSNNNLIIIADGNFIEFVDDEYQDESNNINLDIDGTGNILKISQALTVDALFGNKLSISIAGNSNGGSTSEAFTGITESNGLVAGTVRQVGQENSIDVTVEGSYNLFAYLQDGSRNILQASIDGTQNQSSVIQLGNNNIVAYSQSGNSNMINISQRPW